MCQLAEAFWRTKFEANVKRDRRNQAALPKLGWRVIVVWECEVMKDPRRVLERVRKRLGLPLASDYSLPERKVLLKLAEARLQWGLQGGKTKDEGRKIGDERPKTEDR